MVIQFAWKRRDVPFNGIFLLFAAFIFCCGAGHLLEAVIFYHPIYRVAGLLKLLTAIVSLTTFAVLLKLIPKVLDLPSLVSKNESLRRADAAKSEFLANISHEIRTPMTAILGYADVLYEEGARAGAPPQRREAVDAIQRNGRHLLDLINDILDLSKIEAGKLHTEFRRCDPLAVVDDVVALLHMRACEKGLSLDARVEGSLPETILTDPTRLRQVLINVVGNAVKFTESGSVRIVVRLARADSDRPRIDFEVVDTGIGISPEGIDKLFSPFTQADSSMTRRFGGTGLGLAISKRLAEALGGDISVVSEPGRGSRFTIAVATGSLEGIAVTQRRAAESTGAEDPADRPAVRPAALPYRILLVEDGPDNQRVISFLLEKAGAEVTLAENGEEALQKVQTAVDAQRCFDVVLMDMQMPVLDGYQATRRLRSDGYTRPIIALTAHAMEGDRAKCLAAGCDDYLAKPIERAKLYESVRAFAANAQASHCAGIAPKPT